LGGGRPKFREGSKLGGGVIVPRQHKSKLASQLGEGYRLQFGCQTGEWGGDLLDGGKGAQYQGV